MINEKPGPKTEAAIARQRAVSNPALTLQRNLKLDIADAFMAEMLDRGVPESESRSHINPILDIKPNNYKVELDNSAPSTMGSTQEGSNKRYHVFTAIVQELDAVTDAGSFRKAPGSGVGVPSHNHPKYIANSLEDLVEGLNKVLSAKNALDKTQYIEPAKQVGR